MRHSALVGLSRQLVRAASTGLPPHSRLLTRRGAAEANANREPTSRDAHAPLATDDRIPRERSAGRAQSGRSLRRRIVVPQPGAPHGCSATISIASSPPARLPLADRSDHDVAVAAPGARYRFRTRSVTTMSATELSRFATPLSARPALPVYASGSQGEVATAPHQTQPRRGPGVRGSAQRISGSVPDRRSVRTWTR